VLAYDWDNAAKNFGGIRHKCQRFVPPNRNTGTTLYSAIRRDSAKIDLDILLRIGKELDVPVELFYDGECRRFRIWRNGVLSSGTAIWMTTGAESSILCWMRS
jgi:hypothetical protein